MKKFLTFLTLLTLFFTTSWAETATWPGTTALPGEATSIGEGVPIKIKVSETNTYSNPIRVYANTTITITADAGYVINSVTYESSSTGNYVTNAQNATVSPNVNPTVSGKNVTWSYGNNSTVTEFTFKPSAQTRTNGITVNYSASGSTPTNQVVTPVITLNPESGFYAGDNVTATISCETEGATIHYTMDGTDPTTTSATIDNGGTVTVTGNCTIKAMAVKEGMDDSDIAEKAVSFGPTATTVAEILQLANHTTFKFTGNLVVSGKSGNQLYAQDATGGMHFYGSTPAYDFGDVIPAGFVARFVADYKGAPELDNMSGMVAATETAELNAETLTPSQITTNNENAFIYAVIKNATIANNTITANGETVTVQNTFNVTLPTGGKSYDFYGITNWNEGGRFIPLSFEETYIDPGEGYYLVGNFSGWKRYENYKFTEAEGSLVLNNVTLPDDAEFKIVNKTSSSEIWYGGQTDNTDQANLYVLHGGWHTDIPLTNSENNNYVKNFSIAAGGVTSFTFNTSTMKFDALRAAQVYFTCDKINNWAKEAMTATDNGWTITKQLEAGAKFAFIDEWGGHHGNDWTINSDHYGDNYNIPLGNANTPTMQYAGYYKIDVNSALTVMHVNKEFAINCSANPNGGGNVTAKVGGETVESAMSGETVTIEYTTANGYTFNNITLNGTALEAVEGVYSFTMPNADANVVVNYTAQSYAITVDSPYGTTTCPENATTGSTVTFTVTPETDYEVISVTASFVNGENTTAVTVNYNQETGEYSFNMPPFPVTVTVNYKAPFQSKMYQLIKSAEDLEINKTYLIADKAEADYVLGFANGDRGGVVRVTPAGGIITSTSEMAVITLAGSEGQWQLVSEYGNLGAKSSTNGQLAYNTEATATISINEETGAALITFSNRTDKNILCFNLNSANNNPFFGCYGSNTSLSKDVYIFKEVTPESKTLAGLCTDGVDGKLYTINDEKGLLGVYRSGNTVWFKDEVEKTIELQNETLTVIGGAVDFDKPGDEQNYWINNVRTKDFDQSNWIEVVFPADATGIAYENVYVKNLTGVYSYNGGNRKLTITNVDALEENGEFTYTPNTYIPANFAGTQNGYFFSKPKVQEYAYFVKAQWNGSQMVMATDATNNPEGFTGSFSIMPVDGLDATHHVNDFYQFHGIVRKGTVGSPRLQADGDDIVVEATDLNPDNVVTSISTVGVNGEVKSVKYVSVAGVVSDRPFQGVNIVVTEYTDGTRTTTKVVK